MATNPTAEPRDGSASASASFVTQYPVPEAGRSPVAGNALKHGFYSASILLPGEDAEAYHRERLALFHTYRPQTVHEARLLNTMAEWQWQLQRSSPLQARCDQQALEPVTDAAGRIGEPLNHQRLHSAMDVTVHRQRIDRGANRAHSKLIEVQRLRRLGLIEGAVRLPPGCYMECSGEIVGPVVAAPTAATATAPAEAPAIVRQETPHPVPAPAAPPARDSGDEGNGESLEQKETRRPAGAAEQPSVSDPHGTVPLHPATKRAQAANTRGRLIGGLGARRIYAEIEHRHHAVP